MKTDLFSAIKALVYASSVPSKFASRAFPAKKQAASESPSTRNANPSKVPLPRKP